MSTTHEEMQYKASAMHESANNLRRVIVAMSNAVLEESESNGMPSEAVYGVGSMLESVADCIRFANDASSVVEKPLGIDEYLEFTDVVEDYNWEINNIICQMEDILNAFKVRS